MGDNPFQKVGGGETEHAGLGSGQHMKFIEQVVLQMYTSLKGEMCFLPAHMQN
jgi:hypothetical protein